MKTARTSAVNRTKGQEIRFRLAHTPAFRSGAVATGSSRTCDTHGRKIGIGSEARTVATRVQAALSFLLSETKRSLQRGSGQCVPELSLAGQPVAACCDLACTLQTVCCGAAVREHETRSVQLHKSEKVDRLAHANFQ